MALELSFDTRKYLIIQTSQINLVNFNEVLETSPETMRFNVDNSKTFVKWDGEDPSFINELSNTEGPYNYDQFMVILDAPEWTPTIQP
jgi:hypothetical protein